MKSYEISYLVDPNLSQEEAGMVAGKITSAVEQAGGSIQYVDEPKKRRLSYFVQKRAYAYFGYTDFTLSAESLEALRKALAEEKPLLRLLLVEALKANKNLYEKTYTPRHLAGKFDRHSRSGFQKQPVHHKPPQAEPATEADIAAIDKKLDEILNK